MRNTPNGFTPFTAKFTLPETVAFVAIILLAALLRLGAPEVVEFKRDEANLSYMALDIARGRDFPLLGIDSSVGIRNAPVNVYIMVPPFLISSDPTLATQYVGLLNVIGVALVYLLARWYYGPLAAVVAGLLFAVSPWAVVYSRKIWAQDMLPLFIVMTVGTGLIGFVEGKRWAQWVHLPLLAITGQIHYVCFVLIPITGYLLFIGRRRLTRAFWFSIALTVLVTLPFIIGLARASLLRPDIVQRILAANSSPDKPRQIALSGDSFEYSFFTVAGTNLHSITGAEQFRNFLDLPPNGSGTDALLAGYGIVIIASAAWLVWRAVLKRDARTPVDLTLLLWFAVTPLAFAISWTPVYPHYMIPILPAAYLIPGVAAVDAWQVWHNRPVVRRLIAGSVAIALLVLAGVQVWLVVTLHSFVHTTSTPDGFGTPLGYLIPPRTAILARQPAQVIGALDGQYIGFHDDTTVWNFLLYDVPLVRFEDDVTSVYPAEPVTLLSSGCTGTTDNFTMRTVQEGCLAIGMRAPQDLDLSAYTPISAADKYSFASGLRFMAYQWAADGCLSVVWQTSAGPIRQDFSAAVHFINASGERLFDADGLSYRGVYWRAGDTVVRKFCPAYGLERRAEVVSIRLGLYTTEDTPDGLRFNGDPLLDQSGNAAPDQMVIIRLPGR
jgi:hypothetical protein